ncbi:TIR domain-containing protein [Rhodobium gokarnense]|uniref:Prolyl-tRNA editing enzyme YbaK/EbsC (Cys-tRNA(Pro) deacylase) n=1 Tax=Rhodobium gokarnense TaxID=364296 RepID=A0ABT3HF00_9HYPH|nr:TIR domain-containing protein [Rhodobium gokarnense]MCW2308851.1 prolyl-tRNA editing enzyme YbaK/EbsC (Cys-tRNA(Pro) deacylase) [Rhodobium gokarnense]
MSSITFFIASSSEGRSYVDEVSSLIHSIGAKTINWEEYFQAGDFVLEKLLSASSSVQLAAIIVTPDDMTSSRENEYMSPRDNIILEIGLFSAKLGLKNTAIILCKNTDTDRIKLPTDLGGVVYLNFDKSNIARSNIFLKRQFAQMMQRAKDDRIALELFSTIDNNRGNISKIENDLSEKYILNKIKEILSHARVGEVLVSSDDYYAELYRQIESADKKTLICAVASLSSEIWEFEQDQQIYLEKNIEASRRDVEIRRIFLHGESDLLKIDVEINKQLRNGIHLRRVPGKQPQMISGIEDFVIFYNKDANSGRIFIAEQSKRDPNHIGGGRIVEYHDKSWLMESFNNLWEISIKVTESDLVYFLESKKRNKPPELISTTLDREVITCQQAATAKNIALENELKSIIYRTRMGLVAVHVPGNMEVSTRKVKKQLGLKDAYVSDVDSLKRIGLSPGTVSAVKEPVWSLLNLVSASVFEKDFVSTNDGTLTGYYKFDPKILLDAPNLIKGDFEVLE